MTSVDEKKKNPNCFWWHEVLTVFAISRLLVVGILFALAFVSFSTEIAYGGAIFHAHSTESLQAALQRLSHVLQSADARWYLEIASSGYHEGPFRTDEPKNWAFFPLVPILIRGISILTGSVFSAGLLLNFSMSLLSMVLLRKYAASIGFEECTQSRLIWVFGFFPFSYFFIAPMSEPTFLACTIAAFLLLSTNRVLPSACCMILATACRPTGALLLPAYALALARKGMLRTPRGIAACLLSPLGLFAFCGYLYALTGNALACIGIQEAWGRTPLNITEVGSIPLAEPWNFGLLNASLGLLGLVASIYLARRQLYALSLALALPILFAMSTGTLMSLSRICSGLFPIYIALALWANTPVRERCLLAICAGLLCTLTVGYALMLSGAMT